MNPVRAQSLTDWPLHKRGEVSHVHTRDRKVLQKLIAMGVLPRAEIVLVQKFPSFVFQIQNTRFSIDKELALSIFVQSC